MAEQISEIDADTIDKRISEQKSQEFDIFAQKLNSMLDRIENAFEIQNQFVSDVSHELRTPLTSINGYIKMLKRWGKTDPKIMEESLNSIESSSEYLRDLVDKLLLLTKNDYQIKKEIIDVKNVVEETLNLFKLELSEFKIDIQGESFTVNSSNEYLSLIFKIFIENAIKYSPNQKEITIKLDPDHKSISIQDHGIGIETTKLKNIFERFYKADPSRSDKGHGLGLSIAKKLADALDIELKAYSELGKGSTFTLTFLSQL
jgi:signal transduction histidine kinase